MCRLIQIWEVLSHFLQIFFLFPLLSFCFSYNAHVGEFVASHKSLLCALHFSFCFSDWIISAFLYSSLLIFSSASSNMLNPFSVFFHVIVLFSSRISMWFLFIISIDILILFIYYFPGFLYHLSIPETVGLFIVYF